MSSNTNGHSKAERLPSASRVRVLHLLRRLLPGSGGPLAHLEAVVTVLDREEVETLIATFAPCSPPSSVPAPSYTGGTGWDIMGIRKAWALSRWLRSALGEVDVVQLHGVFGWHLIVGALVCRSRGKPFLVRPHGALSEMFLGLRPMRKRLYLRLLGLPLLRQAHALIAMSDQERQFIGQLDPRLRVVSISPAVECAGAPAQPMPGGVFKVVFLGRVAPVKGLPVLIEAIAVIQRSGVSTSLMVIGDGNPAYFAQLKAQAYRLGVGERVQFLGRQTGARKWELMREAHVFALPSHGENFSHATAEAMAMGLPVVITDRVALAPIIEEAGCGLVVPLGDVDALASALAYYRNPAVRSEASKRARDCAQSRFSRDGMRSSLEALYKDVAGFRLAGSSNAGIG